ncbi:myb-like protein P [Gordionus sp. m RMFG-2023]|uniref:myb-like protein P n=1 Tax=Gordionus sp. m RMFG-2023 TaxID=3053472 RepID=UPI0031FD4B89
MDPCRKSECEAYPNAKCRRKICGNCLPEYYDEEGTVVDCKEELPKYSEINQNCPVGVMEVRCRLNPCKLLKCKMNEKAHCVPYPCGGCYAVFYDDKGYEVDCDTGKSYDPYQDEKINDSQTTNSSIFTFYNRTTVTSKSVLSNPSSISSKTTTTSVPSSTMHKKEVIKNIAKKVKSVKNIKITTITTTSTTIPTTSVTKILPKQTPSKVFAKAKPKDQGLKKKSLTNFAIESVDPSTPTILVNTKSIKRVLPKKNILSKTKKPEIPDNSSKILTINETIIPTTQIVKMILLTKGSFTKVTHKSAMLDTFGRNRINPEITTIRRISPPDPILHKIPQKVDEPQYYSNDTQYYTNDHRYEEMDRTQRGPYEGVPIPDAPENLDDKYYNNPYYYNPMGYYYTGYHDKQKNRINIGGNELIPNNQRVSMSRHVYDHSNIPNDVTTQGNMKYVSETVPQRYEEPNEEQTYEEEESESDLQEDSKSDDYLGSQALDPLSEIKKSQPESEYVILESLPKIEFKQQVVSSHSINILNDSVALNESQYHYNEKANSNLEDYRRQSNPGIDKIKYANTRAQR